MNVIQDTMTLTGRMMKHMTRSADTIITVVVMPIMIMLAFVYILGGAMTIPVASYKVVHSPSHLANDSHERCGLHSFSFK